jgi:hypothetical protein
MGCPQGGAARAARILVALVPLCACAAPVPPPRFEPAPTRGIVLISLDTLRADHLGCYGYGRDTSPFLDRLAERGTLFLHHVVQIPSTLPSHMSMLTGLYPGEHGVFGPSAVLSPKIPLVAEVLHRAGVRTSGHTEGGWVSGRFGFRRGFDDWSDTPYASDTDVARTFDRGIAFLRTLEPGSKFFLFLHTYSIHDPYRPPEPYRSRFWPGPPPPDTPDPTGRDLQRINAGKLRLPPRGLEYYEALYDASIRYVDSELERFYAALEELGLVRETTLIVTSDHGEEFREHGRLAHTQAHYECLHAPLIVVHPAQRTGTRVATVTQTVDLAPTIYELAGVTGPPVSGRSLLPRLRDPETPSDERGYSEAEIYWGMSKSLIVAREGRLDQLLWFARAPDDGGFWSTGKLRVDAFRSHLTFDAVTLGQPREVEVVSDGQPVARLSVTTTWQRFAVDLPGAEGAKRDVLLRCATCVVPAEIGAGPDRRCLSFKVRGLPVDRFELYDLARDPAGADELSARRLDRARELLRDLAAYRHSALQPIGRSELPPAQLEELRALGYL